MLMCVCVCVCVCVPIFYLDTHIWFLIKVKKVKVNL